MLKVHAAEWVTEQAFKSYANAHGLRGYMLTSSWADAAALAQAHGGHAFTEHSGEGDSLFYQRGPGVVDVLGYMVLLPVDLPGDRDEKTGACRVWWPGSPGDNRLPGKSSDEK